ncbi:MAG: hypothetical protein LLG13_18605 [Bacteroidales bacterium]|nr:hypothetical protein [Bacteroidales bacterium]
MKIKVKRQIFLSGLIRYPAAKIIKTGADIFTPFSFAHKFMRAGSKYANELCLQCISLCGVNKDMCERFADSCIQGMRVCGRIADIRGKGVNNIRRDV